jgi:polyribonucleotide nucleotidyltransferase
MTWSKEATIGNRSLLIETGKLAQQADSSVTVRYGDTIVLVTTCIGEERPGYSDFIRLTVDYEERHYAVGKIPGSFIRREGRPSENATLTARLTDRSLRPLLSKGISNEIQIVITVLSTDQENAPDVLALIGASASMALSALPFKGPVGAVRIGYIDDELIVNPTLPQLNESLIDVTVASTKEKVVMIEADGREVSEELILQAIELGHKANQDIIKAQEELRQSIGQQKMEINISEMDTAITSTISSDYKDKLVQAITSSDRDKRKEMTASLKKEISEKLKDDYSEEDIISVFDEQLKKAARKYMLETKKHLDGRDSKEIRPISSEVDLLPRTHGSGLFSRGQTQVLSITTLGSLRQEQLIDGLGLEGTKRFMHHYNFPPFSTGEAKRLGSTSRREIGHGALAERALSQVIPGEEFAYTIRIVSEVLSSNGSTSMASVCASTLSLMDAGVPIKAPVAGIAMGLVTGDNNEYVVLTDIEGLEDAYGDMDFKVAGTRQGITAIQLDIKLSGIDLQIVSDAIYQAREARFEILDNIQGAISSSRSELSPYAPRMYRINIDQSKIGAVIGPGGKTIRSIIEQAKVTVDVENDGTVLIGSPNEESAKKAIEIIEGLTREIEVGAIYTGKVTRLMNFGAFVEVLPGKEGLVHISELAEHHVAKVEDVVKEGDEITVKVTEIDRLGRINLSRRAVFGDSSTSQDVKFNDNNPQRGHPNRTQSRPRSGGYDHSNKSSRNQPFMRK